MLRKTADEKERIAAEVIEERTILMINLKEKKTLSYSVPRRNKEWLSAVCAYLEKRETRI